MSNYGQNPYGQNPYGQPQQPQNPYGQPQQYGRPQHNPYGQPQQPPYGQPGQHSHQQPQNPYGQPQQYGQPQGYPPQQPSQQSPQQPSQPYPPAQYEPAAPRAELLQRDLPVMTTEQMPNATISEVLGEVVGVVARSRELPGGARSGRPAEAYAGYLTRSRQEAVTRMAEMAREAGADAVVGLRFDCSEITQNLSEVSAYGTAVRIEDRGRPGASPATPDRVAGGDLADEVRDAHSDGWSDDQPEGPSSSGSEDDIAHLRPRGWDQPGQPDQGDPYRPSWPPQA